LSNRSNDRARIPGYDGRSSRRRAILERDEVAWAAIHTRYRALLISWAYHTNSRMYAGEWCDDIADQAFARAWVALTPARFAEFPNLPRLLSYLHTCVMVMVFAYIPSSTHLEHLPLSLLVSGTIAAALSQYHTTARARNLGARCDCRLSVC
jgi:hypothetical protein